MLQSSKLYSAVHFPISINTRIHMLIDNVFTDTSKLDNYTILPVYNGLLDHDGQLSSLNQQTFCCKKKKQIAMLKL